MLKKGMGKARRTATIALTGFVSEDGEDVLWLRQTEWNLKFQTDKLISTAEDVEGKIRRLENVFGEIGHLIDSSRSYWEGDGAESYIRTYHEKLDVIQDVFKRFRDNAENLKIIAGVLDKSEKDITTGFQPLPDNLID